MQTSPLLSREYRVQLCERTQNLADTRLRESTKPPSLRLACLDHSMLVFLSQQSHWDFPGIHKKINKKTATKRLKNRANGVSAARRARLSLRRPRRLISSCAPGSGQRFRTISVGHRDGHGVKGLRPYEPWPEGHKRSSQGDRRYKLVETADTVGAIFGAAPRPCATNLQRKRRDDAQQYR